MAARLAEPFHSCRGSVEAFGSNLVDASLKSALGATVLNVFFGDIPEAIYNTAVYFKNTYKDQWITNEYSRRMIKDVDRSDVISESVIQSPVLGSFTPLQLSGGVKTLMLIKFDHHHVFNASTCGDNCAKWILDMAKKDKVVINLYHVMDFGKDEFKIRVINSGNIARNMVELIHESIPYL